MNDKWGKPPTIIDYLNEEEMNLPNKLKETDEERHIRYSKLMNQLNGFIVYKDGKQYVAVPIDIWGKGQITSDTVLEKEIEHLKSQLALCVEALDYIRKISYNEGFKIYRNDKDLVKTTLDKLAAMQSEGEK